MALPAFKDKDIPRGRITALFGSVVMAASAVIVPFTPMSTARPGPHLQQKARIDGAQTDVGKAIRTAYAQRDQAIKKHGLADRANGQVASLFNPAKDGLGVAAATMVPGFAPVAWTLMGMNVRNFWIAERGSAGDYNADYGYFMSNGSEDTRRQTDWSQTGAQVFSAANDEAALDEDEIAVILAPIEANPQMRALFAQQRNVSAANTNIGIREQDGLPRNSDVAAAALEQNNTAWIFNGRPAPACL